MFKFLCFVGDIFFSFLSSFISIKFFVEVDKDYLESEVIDNVDIEYG